MGMFCPGNGKPKPTRGPKHQANLQSDGAEVVVLDEVEEQNASQIASAIVKNEANAEKKDEKEHTLAIVLSSCALMVGIVGLMVTRPNESNKETISKQVYDQIVSQEEEGGAFMETHGQETSL